MTGMGGRDPALGEGGVVGVGLVPHVVPSALNGGHRGGARPEEWVEHQIIGECVELDEPLRKLDGKRGGVPDPAGRLGEDVPYRDSCLEELFLGDGVGALPDATGRSL